MFTILSPKFRKFLLSLALASAMVALTSCGGSSDLDSDSPDPNAGNNDSNGGAGVDTSGITEQKLRSAAVAGMTRGITSNTSAFTSVLGNSRALQELTTQRGSGGGRSGASASARALGDGTDSFGEDAITAQIDDALEFVGDLIDQSDISKNDNVYTFDPNEALICADPSDAAEAANCEAVLSHITFVITVNQVENNEVVAATTAFNYDSTTFIVVDFTATSGYYEIRLAGLRSLLLGLNEVATGEDAIDIPAVMEGSLRIAFTAQGEESGSITLSVPAAISLSDDTEGEEVLINIAITDKLFSLAADGAAQTMELEVSIGALNLLVTDEDAAGSFPVELALSGITGKAVVTEDGDKLTLTGVSAETVTVKVEGTDAASLSLKSFDAMLDASGNNPVFSLSKALDFDLSITNLRSVFEDMFDSEDPGQTLTASLAAPSGTKFEEVGEDIVKVTNGTLDITIDQTGSPSVSVSVPEGSCLDTSDDESPAVAACPPGS